MKLLLFLCLRLSFSQSNEDNQPDASAVEVRSDILHVDATVWEENTCDDCEISEPIRVAQVVQERTEGESIFMTILAIDVLIVFCYLIAKLVITYS
jgi:hypothetical protein